MIVCACDVASFISLCHVERSEKSFLQIKEERAMRQKTERQKQKKELSMRKQTQLFKVDGGLLMFLPFFMVGVTYMRNDYHKKGQIVKMLSQDESYQKL
ncbi:hypothetical protein [Helicobacter bilis]|uniref:hypothetical protein n=1 Tax=Helicobacter bilis TaxID=37372 RepID=UPI0025A9B3C1|nr:hypothetical protein [Helicobacter bilis]